MFTEMTPLSNVYKRMKKARKALKTNHAAEGETMNRTPEVYERIQELNLTMVQNASLVMETMLSGTAVQYR